MAFGNRLILGFAMAVIGFLGSIITCALPAWKSQHLLSCFGPSSDIWEGLWMNCVTQVKGVSLCKVYESSSRLSQDLQVARVLLIISIIFGVIGILLVIISGKCTNFIEDERQKCKVAMSAGITFFIAGLLVLIPVSWTASNITRDFYNELVSGELKELGVSLYIGWGAAGLLLLGGGLLCTNEKIRNLNESFRFSSLENQSEV